MNDPRFLILVPIIFVLIIIFADFYDYLKDIFYEGRTKDADRNFICRYCGSSLSLNKNICKGCGAKSFNNEIKNTINEGVE